MRRYGYQLLVEFVVTMPSDPTSTSDLEHAYGVGQFWINSSTGDCWQCTDDTTGAAVWSNLSAGGGGGGTPSGTVAALTGTPTAGSASSYSRGDHAHGIAAEAVTLANLATQAANTILGNASGVAASPTALSSAQVSTLLGLGTAATQATGFFLQTANNLSDVASPSVARTNLGLGTAATEANSFFLQAASNLSDLASASVARTNLGLGTAATQASSAFDAAGTAATAVTNLLAASNTWTNANAFHTTVSSVGACTLDTGATGSTFGGALSVLTGDFTITAGNLNLSRNAFLICGGVNMLQFSDLTGIYIPSSSQIFSDGQVTFGSGGANINFDSVPEVQGGSNNVLKLGSTLHDFSGAVTISPPTNLPTGCTKWVYMPYDNNGTIIFAVCASP